MRTARAFRRRGLGSTLLRALAGYARDAGARSSTSRSRTTTRALGLYQRLGFEAAYGYHYRELAAG